MRKQRIIGYALVSTSNQNLNAQIHSLTEYGCKKLFKKNLLKQVESISRLGRKTLDILSIIQQLEEIGIQLVSLKENMDAGTPIGKAMLQMMCAIAELEINMIEEREKEEVGQVRSVAKSQVGHIKKEKFSIALRMYDIKEYSIKEIIAGTGTSQGSSYRAINQRKLEETQR